MGRTAVAPAPALPPSRPLDNAEKKSATKSVLAAAAAVALFERMRKPKVDVSGGRGRLLRTTIHKIEPAWWCSGHTRERERECKKCQSAIGWKGGDRAESIRLLGEVKLLGAYFTNHQIELFKTVA